MNNCRRDRRQVAGFTLIELMIVLLILAILLAIAVPSFSTMIKKNNVEALQAKLSSSVATARSEAASRNVTTSICRSTDGTACTGDSTDWKEGWIVFTDRDADGVIDAADGDEILDVHENTNVTYTVTMSTSASALTFSTQGFLLSANEQTILVCEPDNDDSYARGVYIARSGLLVKTSDTDNDGTHNDPQGGELDCAP